MCFINPNNNIYLDYNTSQTEDIQKLFKSMYLQFGIQTFRDKTFRDETFRDGLFVTGTFRDTTFRDTTFRDRDFS